MKRTLLMIVLASCVIAGSTFAAPPKSATPKTVKSGARLDDVHIKGEIPEPQVLFVVGRERRRFLDFQHRRYLVGAAGTTTGTPAWVRVIDSGR